MRPSKRVPHARKTATAASLLVAAAAASSLCLTAAPAAAQAPEPRTVHLADPPPRPTCTPADPADFPLVTRIRNAPDRYDSGGAPKSWILELTNTTGTTCTGVHPIVVLVDEKRALRPKQLAMHFTDGDRQRPVRFEESGKAETIGVFDDFPGFTVRPGQTVRVPVRLAVTGEAEPNYIVANAALVQRRDDDGDWVGESNDYRFRIVAAAGTTTGEREKATGKPEQKEKKEAEKEKGTETGAQEAEPGKAEPERTEAMTQPDEQSTTPQADELAMTGPGALLTAAAAVTVLLTIGALLFVTTRRGR